MNDDVHRRASEQVERLRSSSQLPEGLTEDLDAAFEAIAPPGARASGSAGLAETLINWRFDPEIPLGGTRARFGRTVRMMKRIMRPLTTWQLRHLTDQMNAYAAMQAEVLKELLEKTEERR